MRPIETTNLTRVFREPGRLFRRAPRGTSTALAGVSLTVEQGECVALVGPNGAGKSTLLRVLATLVLPTDGAARVQGLDVVARARDVRRALGVMTGGDRSFFWRLSGWENLVFFGELQGLGHDLAKQRAWEQLEQVGLLDAADQRLSGYSTGMRQRLALARALLHAPAVLLLDEPTANLDLEHRGQVLDLLRGLLASGDTSALIASHDAGLAASLAHRTVRMEAGSIDATRPHHAPARYRIIARGLAAEQRAALGAVGIGDELEVDDLGDGHALTAALAAIVASGGEVVSVETLGRSLPV